MPRDTDRQARADLLRQHDPDDWPERGVQSASLWHGYSDTQIEPFEPDLGKLWKGIGVALVLTGFGLAWVFR